MGRTYHPPIALSITATAATAPSAAAHQQHRISRMSGARADSLGFEALLINGLLSANNEARREAEAQYANALDRDPAGAVRELLRCLQNAQVRDFDRDDMPRHRSILGATALAAVAVLIGVVKYQSCRPYSHRSPRLDESLARSEFELSAGGTRRAKEARKVFLYMEER